MWIQRAVKQFDDKGTVTAKKNKGSCLIIKSLLFYKLLWRGLLEVCRHVYDATGYQVSCMPFFANATNFPTRNAKQHSELLRQCFMS